MPLRFLTARWSHLAMLHFAIPAPWLRRHLPPGCEPDTSLDGKAYVSLVGFNFLQTRVLGVRWPGLTDFPEFNLRGYVRHVASGDRGVVFIREIVPSRLIAVEHTVRHDGRVSRMTLLADPEPYLPPPDSREAWFKEHRWGFNRTSHGGRLRRYEVVHPAWRCHRVASYELDWDFEGLYGHPWGALHDRRADLALLAEGSDVSVYVWKSRPATEASGPVTRRDLNSAAP